MKTSDLERIMSKVEYLRTERESLNHEIERVLGIECTVAELGALYEELGDEVDEDVIRDALELYGKELGTFRPPDSAAGKAFGHLWVRRWQILLPALVVFAVSGVIAGGVRAGRRAQQAQQVERVKGIVKSTCTRWDSQKNRAADLNKQRSKLPAVEADIVGRHIELATGRYAELGPAGAALCSTEITLANVEQVGKDADAVKGVLNQSDRDLKAAQKIVKEETALQTSRATIERVYEQFPDSAPSFLHTRARNTHRAGVAALDREDLAAARRAINELRDLDRQATLIETSAPEVERLYTELQNVARSPRARADGEAVYRKAKRQLSGPGADALASTVAELRDLVEEIDREYTLVIFGGDERAPNDNPTARNYYLLVAAHEGGPDGEILGVRVLNEETGNTERVCGWGERVPEGTYERVKADKVDNGLIDDNVYGHKRRGYLNPDYERGYQPVGGRITEWERGQAPASVCK